VKFGINTQALEFELALAEIESSGLGIAKVFLDPAEEEKVSRLNPFQVYLSFLKADENIFKDWDIKLKRIEDILNLFQNNVLGVSLFEEASSIVRRGTSRTGIFKETVIIRLNEMASVIRGSGFPVVFPVLLDDIQGNFWEKVDCDIYDIEVFFKDKNPIFNLKSPKPFWLGKVSKFGGHSSKSQEGSTYRKILEIDSEYAFLYVDNNRFQIKDKVELQRCNRGKR
jgi:hypothetical protein